MSDNGTPPIASGSGTTNNTAPRPQPVVRTVSSATSAAPARPATAPRANSNGKAPATAPNRQPSTAPIGGRVVQGAGNASGGASGQQRPAGGPVVQPGAGPGGIVKRTTLNAVLINVCQKGNPVISHIRNVPWEYGDIKVDYQVGASTGVLYLSLRYHLLHPEYIHTRISNVGQAYTLRLVIVQCDVENHQAAIRELTKVCIVNEYTMLVAWSAQEVGRYLEIYKSFERKPPDLIKERVDNSYMSHLTSALTSVRGVNKTDVTTLASNFLTFDRIVSASPDTLALLPGLGDKKIKRLRDAFEGSFSVGNKKKKISVAQQRAAEGPELN